MSSSSSSREGEVEETTTTSSSSSSIPTAAVLCLAIGAYVMLLVVALIVRRYLKTKEFGCGKELDCPCRCSSLRPTSDCCCCNIKDCFQRIFSSCSNKVRCDCCHLPSFKNVCCGGKPAFDCGRCDCTCSCRLPECHSINCCCFVIHIKS